MGLRSTCDVFDMPQSKQTLRLVAEIEKFIGRNHLGQHMSHSNWNRRKEFAYSPTHTLTSISNQNANKIRSIINVICMHKQCKLNGNRKGDDGSCRGMGKRG